MLATQQADTGRITTLPELDDLLDHHQTMIEGLEAVCRGSSGYWKSWKRESRPHLPGSVSDPEAEPNPHHDQQCHYHQN